MKKHLTLKNVLVCLGFVFGLVAFFMMFTNQLYASGYGITVYVGFKDALFGDGGAPLSFVGYLLVLLAALGACLLALTKDAKISKLGILCAAVLSLVGAIFIFLEAAIVNGDSSLYHLAAGPVIGGIFAILAAVLFAAAVLLKDKKLA